MVSEKEAIEKGRCLDGGLLRAMATSYVSKSNLGPKGLYDLPTDIRRKLLPYILDTKVVDRDNENLGWLSYLVEEGFAKEISSIVKKKIDERASGFIEYGMKLLDTFGAPYDQSDALLSVMRNSERVLGLGHNPLRDVTTTALEEFSVLGDRRPEYLKRLIDEGFSKASKSHDNYIIEACIKASKYLDSSKTEDFWERLEDFAIKNNKLVFLEFNKNRYSGSRTEELEEICSRYIEAGDYHEASDVAGLIGRDLTEKERTDIVKNVIGNNEHYVLSEISQLMVTAEACNTEEGYKIVADALLRKYTSEKDMCRYVRILARAGKETELSGLLDKNYEVIGEVLFNNSSGPNDEKLRKPLAKVGALYLERGDFENAQKMFGKAGLKEEAELLKEDVDLERLASGFGYKGENYEGLRDILDSVGDKTFRELFVKK